MKRALIVLVGIIVGGCSGPDGSAGASGNAPPGEPDSWRVITESPLTPGYGHDGVWTGKEMIVWGGSRLDPDTLVTTPMRDGAAYNPRTDSWRRISPAPIKGGPGYSVLWTGEEMLVWGDPDRGRATKGNRGAAFDPASNEWRRIPAGPLSGRSGHLAVWTGDEMIVWGGWLTSHKRERYDGEGAAFDPTTNEWRMLPDAPLPAGYDAMGAWTGEEVIVMVTPLGNEPEDYPKFDEVGAFKPSTNAWREIESPPFVSYVSPPVAFLDEQLLVLSLGGEVDGGEVNNYGRSYDTGGIYDVSADEWRAHSDPPTRPNQTWPQIALDDEVVIDGLAYDADADSWRVLPEFPLHPREFPVRVWTGRELIIWGGAELPRGNRHVDPPPPLNDGAAYTPPR